MKSTSMKIAVPNGLLFVRDSKNLNIPNLDDETASCWSMPTCIMIQCLVDSEGETSITIGAANQVKPDRKLLFDGTLDTPSRKVILEIVPGEKVFEMGVPFATNRIRIWTDGRHRLAETVVIGLG
ncbi:MAG: hypothetical protein K2Y71_20930 [Xanthobacteraceae bacterium]|nr:hypothetical protein [Xanthobacteraceae bacterium]